MLKEVNPVDVWLLFRMRIETTSMVRVWLDSRSMSMPRGSRMPGWRTRPTIPERSSKT